jgi:hypothetical protein
VVCFVVVGCAIEKFVEVLCIEIEDKLCEIPGNCTGINRV